jgi:hypothetical protein
MTDWTALGTWCLFGTGVAGVWVAWRQLRALNDSEKLKNTLELLRRYDREPVPFMHEGKEESLTASVAFARCAAPGMLDFFRTYDLSQGLNADYRRRWASIVVAMNYFKAVGALWERGVLDEDLFFGYLAPKVVQIFELWEGLQTLRGEPVGTYGLGDFAIAAQKFMAKKALQADLNPPS